MKSLLLNEKGQNIANVFLGLMVVCIIAIAVVIPVTVSTITNATTCVPQNSTLGCQLCQTTFGYTVSNASMTGISATLIGYIPMMLGVALIVAVVAAIGFRR